MSTPNIHPQEIENFESLAQDWWIREGTFKTLHDINPLRLGFITQQVDLLDKTILDVGCGGGILTESLANHSAQVTGIDASKMAISAAQEHVAEHNKSIVYIETTVEEMAKKQPQQFDVVVCMELLEHVPDPLSVVQSCADLLKPRGHVFFSTLNRNLKSYLFAILGAEYVLKLLPRGLHHYDQFIRPAELASWMRQADLDLIKMSGISYNPFKQQYHLTDNVGVNYLVYGRK